MSFQKLMDIESLEKAGSLHMHHGDDGGWSQHPGELVVQQQLVGVGQHNQCHITDDIRFSIIDAVRQLTGIWDSQREKTSGATRKELFGEVARQVSGQHQIDPPLMPEEVEKQWKNLKDTFIKTRKKVSYNSDGSLVTPKWKFYTFLTFLDSLNRKRRYEEEDMLPPNLIQMKRIREDEEDDDEYSVFCHSLVHHMKDIGQRDRITYLNLAKKIRDLIHDTQMSCIMGTSVR